MITERIAAATLAITFGGLAAHAQTRTTTVQDGRGQQTTVVTDGQGTRTYDNAGRQVYGSGGDRHQEQVDYGKQNGGHVVDDH